MLSSRTPSRTMNVALKIVPSAYMSMRSIAAPGNAPPMSRWCAVFPENPMSSPAWKTGAMTAMSGVWLAPL